MKTNSIKVEFLDVTPAQAREWMVKHNRGNRKMRESTVSSYARDMRNGDWILNHQGLAFNEEGVLVDGQHRLAAVVESGCTVPFMVSTGWPAAEKKRTRLMDTVDRGAARSIADILGLQHQIEHPRFVVMTAACLARACLEKPERLKKVSTSNVLGVLEAFRDGIRFAVANRPTSRGLRQAHVLAGLALAYRPHPKEVPMFLQQLITGAGLEADNPILPLRNWLLSGDAMRAQFTKTSAVRAVTEVVNHLHLWMTGGKSTKLMAGAQGLDYFKQLQPGPVAAVRALLEESGPPQPQAGIAETKPSSALQSSKGKPALKGKRLYERVSQAARYIIGLHGGKSLGARALIAECKSLWPELVPNPNKESDFRMALIDAAHNRLLIRSGIGPEAVYGAPPK